MSVERLCVFTRTKFRLKKVNFGPSVASKMRKNRSEFNVPVTMAIIFKVILLFISLRELLAKAKIGR